MQIDSPDEASLFEFLRRAIADAERRGYDRGVTETMEKIQRAVLGDAGATSLSDLKPLGVGVQQDGLEDDTLEGGGVLDRKRAPKGLVRKVIARALYGGIGLSVQEIEATARGDMEKMIQPSSYRSELRKGRTDGLYREDSGRWYLVANEKTEERQQSTPSVFGSLSEGR